MSLKFEDFEKLRSIYIKNSNNPNLFTRIELQTVMTIMKNIPFYKQLQEQRGYVCLKELCLNMKLKYFYANSIVKRYNKERTKYYHLLYGQTSNSYINVGRSASKEEVCICDCCFGEFIFAKYIQLTNEDINIKIKKFQKKLKTFFPFESIKEHDYTRLFLHYDKLFYKNNEIVYKEGQELDGIYLIINGIFEVYKKAIPKNHLEIELERLDNKIKFLKKESNYLTFLLNGHFNLSKKDRPRNLDSKTDDNKTLFFPKNNPNELMRVRINYLI
jgi:hypothetical protein